MTLLPISNELSEGKMNSRGRRVRRMGYERSAGVAGKQKEIESGRTSNTPSFPKVDDVVGTNPASEIRPAAEGSGNGGPRS